jgi:hypothetical protein
VEVGLAPEFEELRSKFELLDQMFQPVHTENEQRKLMLADTRKTALEISRSRQDLRVPTKRMGELDNVHLHRLGVAVEEISLLQDTVCNPLFYPWRTRQIEEGGEDVETVVNWADEQLQTMVRKYEGCGSGRGREVAEEVLRCNKELQQWNPSGGYCVTIPYHHGEQRELKPDELLKIAVGMNVSGCRSAADGGGSGSNNSEGTGPGAGGDAGSAGRGGRSRGHGHHHHGNANGSWQHVPWSQAIGGARN